MLRIEPRPPASGSDPNDIALLRRRDHRWESVCTCGDGRVASRSRGPGLGAHANDNYYARIVIY